MDIASYKNDVWGQEVLRGVSWDLLWLVIVAAFIVIAGHAIYEAMQKARREAVQRRRQGQAA